jgi:uncharacterized protein HemY
LVELFPDQSSYRTDLANAHDRLARLFKQHGKEQEAVQAFRHALEQGSEKSDNNLAWILLTCADQSLRDAPLALSLAKQAVERAPRSPDFRSTLGMAYFRCQDWLSAEKELHQAADLRGQPHGAECMLLAMTYWHRGDRNQAHEWYDKGAAWLPANHEDIDYADVVRLRDEAEALLAQETTDGRQHQ